MKWSLNRAYMCYHETFSNSGNGLEIRQCCTKGQAKGTYYFNAFVQCYFILIGTWKYLDVCHA